MSHGLIYIIKFTVHFKLMISNSLTPKAIEITVLTEHITLYEGCSNMNASSIITFFAYMLQQNGKRFYKGLYVTFKLAPDLKKNTVCLLSYSPLIEGHVSILTNPMLRT